MNEMEKGQTSIEFLIIILIILVYIFTVTKPIIESAQTTIEDIKNLSQTNNEVQKIVQSINRLSNFSTNSKETITLIIPTGSKINCYPDGNIGFSVEINKEKNNPSIRICTNDTCDKNYSTNTLLDCQVEELTKIQTIIIEKTENDTIIKKG